MVLATKYLILALTFILSASQPGISAGQKTELLNQAAMNVSKVIPAYIEEQAATTANATTTPTFGAITPAPEVTPQDTQIITNVVTQNPMNTPVDLSGITVDLEGPTNPDKTLRPFGYYNLKVRVLDTNGKTIEGAPIKMDAPDYFFTGVRFNPADGLDPNFNKTTNQGSKDDVWTSFMYVPDSVGTKNIAFTSGNLTKTITIEVQ